MKIDLINDHPRLMLVLAGFAVLLLMSVGSIAIVGASSPPKSVGPTWLTYFYPLRDGRTCQASFAAPGLSGNETLKVTSVTKTPEGTRVTVDQSGDTEAGGKAIPTNAALQYTLGRNGTLTATSANALFGGNSAKAGNSVIPSVKSLLEGHTSDWTIPESVPLSGSDLSQLQGELKPGQTSLNLSTVLQNRGGLVPILKVPLGSFHNVLVVETTLARVQVNNAASPTAARELASALKPQLERTLNLRTWYAKGMGPVQVSLEGLTVKDTACHG